MTGSLADVHRIDNDLWAIDEIGKDIMYLIDGGRRALLIDTGFAPAARLSSSIRTPIPTTPAETTSLTACIAAGTTSRALMPQLMRGNLM